MKLTVIAFLSILISTGCISQPTSELIGGPCEGCEAIFEYGDRNLFATDTLPDFYMDGNQIKVHGTVYKNDGVTPAKDVILYVYHTNQKGTYEVKSASRGWERRHGFIRGWVKTDQDGIYAIYTLKPGAYPNGSEPAHIHYTILEPNGKYYWLESCYFSDDPLLSDKESTPVAPRGGKSGILNLKKDGGILIGKRDIILGRNIPGY